MKKILIILLVIGIMSFTGCTKSNAPQAVTAEASLSSQKASPAVTQSAQPSFSTAAVPSAAKPSASAANTKSPAASSQNPFFFQNGVNSKAYKGVFLFNDAYEGQASLQIKKIEDLSKGTVYELKLDPVDGVPAERLSLGYFYVQQDKIYKTDPTQDSLDTLKANEIPCSCFIVCQDKEVKDQFEGQPGFHQYITVNGDRREYHSYNDETGTGYYESFTWEKGNGLVAYRSGFGAERDSMELQLGQG